jgi:hypothetical protein
MSDADAWEEPTEREIEVAANKALLGLEMTNQELSEHMFYEMAKNRVDRLIHPPLRVPSAVAHYGATGRKTLSFPTVDDMREAKRIGLVELEFWLCRVCRVETAVCLSHPDQTYMEKELRGIFPFGPEPGPESESESKSP